MKDCSWKTPRDRLLMESEPLGEQTSWGAAPYGERTSWKAAPGGERASWIRWGAPFGRLLVEDGLWKTPFGRLLVESKPLGERHLAESQLLVEWPLVESKLLDTSTAPTTS